MFSSKPEGFYVDVGAGHPMRDSVTKHFYDAGWSGLNIEPGPFYAELVEARPRDVNLELAVASQEGEADFWISSPDSGFSGFQRLPDELVPEGFSFTCKRVRCARLDAVINEHAEGRTIDFLKIDVEGAEREVLSSFDPDTIRPTVILVEAISPLENHPNHEGWESLLVDHGYVFAAFDGINRFYVPVEHDELINTLAYPISALDRYQAGDAVAGRRRVAQQLEKNELLEKENELREKENELLEKENESLRDDLEAVREAHSTLEAIVHRLEVENRTLAEGREHAAAELRALRATVSWRATRPLRSVRARQLRWRRSAAGTRIEHEVVRPGGFARHSLTSAAADPVFQVSGVAATEILRRCAALRAAPTTAARTTWSLADFAGVADDDFVRAAHVALLGRLPGEEGSARRTAQLRSGRSRLEILARLALSPEGRRARHQRVSGVALRSLVAAGQSIEFVASVPVVGAVVRRMERLVRHEVSAGP